MNYIKFVIFTFIVMIVELVLSYLIAYKFNIRLLDATFFVGVFFSAIFIFFSSSGGLFTNASETLVAKSYIGLKNKYKINRTIGSLRINCFNFGSVLFLLIGFILAFFL
ncbi:hypothetical protein ACQKP0_13685 [Heyndrickxia sp. NPDC080065]|uniref:hypothetical protein n=1 Tax=Heyndrickxia sp. NPDC080065 TaxID=3390568 RepID=UPI003D01F614